jgi:hypothetical protein
LTEGNTTVVGIDGYAPLLREYEVTWANDSKVDIEFYVDEPLGNASISIQGPENVELGFDRFTETDTPKGNEFLYETNYTFDAEGEYRIRLEWVSDEYDNTEIYFADRDVVHDLTAPDPHINGPTTATVGKEVVFDGTESTDAHEIEGYEWVIDGNQSATGETIATNFTEPGRHEVALTVTDGRGNEATVDYAFEVLDATTVEDVQINETNGTGLDIEIGPDRSKKRVLIEQTGGLAGNGTAILDSLTLTVPTNGTANLTTSASSGAPSGFDGPNGDSFETFDVNHSGATVSDVTFHFSVNRTAIDAATLSIDAIALYREQQGWTRLPTLRVGGDATHVQYRATSPGLSRFVIGGSEEFAQDTDGTGDGAGTDESGTDETGSDTESVESAPVVGEPAFAVVEGRLLTRNVSIGEPVVVRATIANDGNASGTYVAGLRVNGTVVRTRSVTIPAGEIREVTIAETAASGGAVTVNGTRLGSVTIGGEAAGTGGGGGGGGIPIPNPLSLWPGGLVGQVLGGIIGLVVVVFGALKGLALYLGY